MKNSLRILLFFVAMLLVACSTGIDSDLFESESSCKAPCWHQLVPGQSTTSDVVRFLDSPRMRFWWPDRNVHKYGAQIDWIRISDRTQPRIVDLYMEDGKLTFIRSWGSTSATLGQVVEHFGPPEYVLALLAVGPERSVYVLEVYYPKRGLGFEMSALGMGAATDHPDVGQISADMPVEAIQYYQPGDLRSYFTVRQPAFPRGELEVEKELQPWPGFGKVKVIETH